MTKGKVSVKNSLMYPNTDEWAQSALKTVNSHYGHSCGWFWHEALIWLQVLLGKTSRPEKVIAAFLVAVLKHSSYLVPLN